MRRRRTTVVRLSRPEDWRLNRAKTWLPAVEQACGSQRLLVAVSDSTLGQVVGGKFQRNPVAVHYLDAIAPESSGHRRQHGPAGVKFDRKHSSFELLDDLADYFDCVFFWQMF
jgi:hypothetical protein